MHAHALPPENRAASESIPVGSGVAGRAVAEREPVLLSIESYPEIGLPHLVDALRQAGFLTLAATPFLAQGQVYGALTLLSRLRLQASPHMLSLQTAVGTQVGLAVSHAAELERLAVQERLAALGRLAAGVAHAGDLLHSTQLVEGGAGQQDQHEHNATGDIQIVEGVGIERLEIMLLEEFPDGEHHGRDGCPAQPPPYP